LIPEVGERSKPKRDPNIDLQVVAQPSLHKHRLVKACKKEVSGFEVNHCVTGVDADCHIAVRVILKYAANVDCEPVAVLFKEVQAGP
jgi:hypothetical protein